MRKKYYPPAVPFDLDQEIIEDLKKNEGFRKEWLNGLLTEKDIPHFAASLKPVVDALGGVGKLAKETGLGRESLYKALSGKVLPDMRTLIQILDFAGYDLSLKKKKEAKRKRVAPEFSH